MTATIFEIKRFAVHDGDGIRTTVFFKGCPLRCLWCHNPEGLTASTQLGYFAHKCVNCHRCLPVCPQGAHVADREGIHRFDPSSCVACGACTDVCLGEALTLYGKEMTVEELLPLLTEDRDFYRNSGGGVTLSGGECLLYPDFCATLLSRLQEEGIPTAVDTCGFVPRESFLKVLPFTDVFLYDIKAIDEQTHRRCTGVSNERILENLHYLNEAGASVEVRIPFVPGHNDTEIEAIATFLQPLSSVKKVRLLPYHNYAGSKYGALSYENTMPKELPDEGMLKEAEATLREHLGERFVSEH